MPSYVTPKKNTQYIFYVSLVSQANTKLMKVNPTIAAGDFKVSTDGGALGNLGTLPTVTPAAGAMVKITLASGEMNGDNVTVVCSDAAGAEWCDLTVNIQTSARQIDDLAYPTVSGRSLDVAATGEAGIDFNNINDASGAHTLTNITVPVVTTAAALTTNNDKTGYALTSGERDSVADATLDRANGIETGMTLRQALRLCAAALAGKLSGAATTTVTIRNAVADSKARITATVDSDGNRSAITTDVT